MTKSIITSFVILLATSTFAFAQSGALDPTWSEDGIQMRDIGTNSLDIPYGAAMQKDGKLLMVGASSGDFTILRFLQDGTPDNAFGLGGLVSVDYNGLDDRCHAVTVQSDGKIVLAGETNISGQPDFAVLRLLPDGKTDSTFGINGWATTDLGTDYEFPNCVTLQRDGKILAAGRKADGFVSDIAMVRYHTDGQLDTFFGEHGIVTTNLREEDEAFAIAVQPDQQIILAGFASISASGDFALVRYNPDGTPDKLFGIGGKVLTDLEGTNQSDFIKSMLLQPDGKILVAGNANQVNIELTSDAGMARYDKNGNLDPTFGIGGKYIIPFGSKTDINAVAMQADGKILLGGSSDVLGDTRWLLARFLPAAGLDTTFGNMGIITTDLIGTRENVVAVFVQPDSRIIMTGSAGVSPNLDFVAARYIADFALAFSVEGVSCYNSMDGTIVAQTDGGVAPYEFSIDGGATYQASNIFNNLQAGFYRITIRDTEGRVGVMGPIEVKNQPAPPHVEVVAEAGGHMIEINVEGESTGFQYSIDGGITYQAENIFTDLADGTYDVMVINPFGCVIHTEQVLISTLGIASLNVLSFNLSPNPGDGLINIELPRGTAPLQLQIVDMTGTILFRRQIDGSVFGNQKIDLRFLPDGNYILRINDGEKWGVRKMIIIK